LTPNRVPGAMMSYHERTTRTAKTTVVFQEAPTMIAIGAKNKITT
jgi:hypothetical protein